MDPQLVVVGLIVVVAMAYVLRRTVRTWVGGKKGACSGGCGCSRTVERAIPERDGATMIEKLQVRQRR